MMIKHTMQEIADFFGLPVAKDDYTGKVFMYDEEPKINKDFFCWSAVKGFTDITFLVSDASAHNWRVLVKPSVVKENLTTEYVCPSCGKPLQMLYKPLNKEMARIVCSDCGEEIQQSLIDEMIKQAR